MDKLNQYQTIVKQALTEYGTLLQSPPAPPYDIALIFDDQHNHYLIREIGWTDKGRVRQTILHLTIRNGKIWVEEDWTEEGVATFLVQHGVPQKDIVLGFQPPDIRQYSEFAVA